MIEVPAERWDALLDELHLHDVYLRREYVESAGVLEPGRPVLLAEQGVAFAAIVREAPRGRLDVITPYGYGGPVAADGADPDGFAAAYGRWCAAAGVVATFVRFHPLYGNDRYAGGFDVEQLAGTVAWRLDGDLVEGMHRHHRRVARKAEAAGLEVDVRVAPLDLAAFVQLYDLTMERQAAASFYRFPEAYWHALLEGLRKRVVLVEARRGGELLAALLCLAARPWLHYHLGASSDEGRKLGASALAFLSAAQWAQEREYELFHLGGGVGGGRDSLLEFKLRFAPRGLRPMSVGKAVHDAAAYRELSGTDDTGGFFPAYRRPRQVAGAGDRAR